MSSEQDIFRVAGSSRTIEPMPLVADMLRMSSSGTYAYTQMMDIGRACVGWATAISGVKDRIFPAKTLSKEGQRFFFFLKSSFLNCRITNILI